MTGIDGIGQLPAEGQWGIKIALQLADDHGLRYHAQDRGQRVTRMYRAILRYRRPFSSYAL